MVLIISGPPIQVEVTSSPGAYTLTQAPKFENSERSSLTLIAPTESTSEPFEANAGELLHATWFSFPAATLKWIPAALARCTARSMVVDLVTDPSDMDATEPLKLASPDLFSWFEIIQSIPLRISDADQIGRAHV